MNKRATLALLLSVGVVGPAWAQEVDCDSSKVLKSVIAVSGNRHAVDANGQLIGNPPVNTWDIYLLDPDQVDANGILSVWRHLPGNACLLRYPPGFLGCRRARAECTGTHRAAMPG